MKRKTQLFNGVLALCLAALPALAAPNIDLARFPMSFAAGPGEGQFTARGNQHGVQLTRDGATLIFAKTSLSLRVRGQRSVMPVALDKLPGTVNLYLGNDPSKWQRNLPTHSRIAYRQVLPGIDLLYYGSQEKLEYDFELAPGAKPGSIVIEIGSEWSPSLAVDGSLSLVHAEGSVTFAKPVAYQLSSAGERQPVTSAYRIHEDGSFGFTIGAYDRSRKLIVDPTLVYATYLGGSHHDFGFAVTNRGDSAYVTGRTFSSNFPITAGPGCPATPNSCNTPMAFVTKFNTTGSAILYSTYLGGFSQPDSYEFRYSHGTGIALDSAGNAWVAGTTGSYEFPLLNPLQTIQSPIRTVTWPGPCNPGGIISNSPGNYVSDAFVVKLNPTGNLLYSTYLGGTWNEFATGIVVNAQDQPILTGQTRSRTGYSLSWTSCSYDQGLYAEFPFPTTAGAFTTDDIDRETQIMGFVTRLSSNGQAILYSSYIGVPFHRTYQDSDPSSPDTGPTGIAIDSTGRVYVSGYTVDDRFGTGCHGCQTAPGKGNFWDAWAAKIDTTLNGPAGLVWLRVIGGEGRDYATGVAVDSANNSYITGVTEPPDAGFSRTIDFPTTLGVYKPTRGIGNGFPRNHGFLVKLDGSGTTLFSTLFGTTNNGEVIPTGVAVHSATQTAFITGYVPPGLQTLPLVNSVTAGNGGAFLTRFNSNGSGLLFSSYLSINDAFSQGSGVSVDSALNAYIAGYSNGGTTMNTPGAYSAAAGNNDAFLAKVSTAISGDCQSNADAQVTVTRGGFRLNNATGRFIQTVSVRNNSAATLTLPNLALDSLSGNATLYNGGGKTSCAVAGSPFISLGSTLGAGATSTVVLEFTNPSRGAITYTPRALAGAGIP